MSREDNVQWMRTTQKRGFAYGLTCFAGVMVIIFATTVVWAGDVLLWDDLRLDLRQQFVGDGWHEVIVDSGGDYRILWTRTNPGGSEREIVFRAFSSSGVPLTPERVLRRLPANTRCDAVGSGFGTYVLVTIERRATDSLVSVQRFAADGSWRDAAPIVVYQGIIRSYRAMIDREEAVIVGIGWDRYENGYRAQTHLYYLNRTGVVDSVIEDLSGDNVRREFVDLAPADSGRVRTFYSRLETGVREQVAVEKRLFRYQGTTLSAGSGYVRVSDYAPAINWYPADVYAVGRVDNSCALFMNMCFEADFYGVIITDVGGVGTDWSWVTTWTRYSEKEVRGLASGFGGCNAIIQVGSGTEVSASLYQYGGYLKTINCLSARRQFLRLDAQKRLTESWASEGWVFICRHGTDSLPIHRVNGLDESPLRGAVALSGDGVHRFAAWVAGAGDSICVNGRRALHKGDTSSMVTWAGSVGTGGSTASFGLAAVNDTVALSYVRSESPTQSSVWLSVWKVGQAGPITTRTLGQTGFSVREASLAAGSGRWVVVWEQSGGVHGDTPWVYIQSCGMDGSAPEPAQALSQGSGPRICKVGDGSFLVTFSLERRTTVIVGGIPVTRVTSNVYGVFLSPAGQVLAGPVRLNERPDNAREPRAVYLAGTNRVFACWKESAGGVGATRLYGTAVTVDGVRTGQEILCAVGDSSVGAYDIAAVTGTDVFLVWHSTVSKQIYLQRIVPGLVVGPAEQVSTTVADPDVPVTVSCAGADSVALMGWISGSHLGRTPRMFLGDLLISRQSAGIRYASGRRISMAGKENWSGRTERFSLSGRRLDPTARNIQLRGTVYYERDQYGKGRVRIDY